MKLTVIVPTYRRPKDLHRCLIALTQQSRMADEVIVVAREEDAETKALLADFPEIGVLPLNVVIVEIPGQVAALNAGLDAASGDAICITDDDAAPRAQWLARIEAHFVSDKRVGGVGGRDWMTLSQGMLTGQRDLVGKIQSFGRIIGNHHLGFGAPRKVEILKGANMSYRAEAIRDLRFDTTLRGRGAQVHNDMGFSLSVLRKGWDLLYDPLVEVDHYPAERFDEDGREVKETVALENAAYNLHWVVLHHLTGSRRMRFLGWMYFVGTRDSPGLLHVLRGLKSGNKDVIRCWEATQRGARDAKKAFLQQASRA